MEATRIKWGLAMDGDEDWEEEEEILENATHCPTCDNLEGHDILKEKSVGSGADFLVRCQVCSMFTRLNSAHP